MDLLENFKAFNTFAKLLKKFAKVRDDFLSVRIFVVWLTHISVSPETLLILKEREIERQKRLGADSIKTFL